MKFTKYPAVGFKKDLFNWEYKVHVYCPFTVPVNKNSSLKEDSNKTGGDHSWLFITTISCYSRMLVEML